MRTDIDFDRERHLVWTEILIELLENNEGNLVEIGAGHGTTTQLLCKIAKENNRKVIAVDPFESGWHEMPESYKYAIDEFSKLLDEYDNLHLIAKSSQDPSVLGNLLAFDPITFCFIDGLQSVEAVLSDIALMEKLNTTLICIDDADRLTGDSRVPEALSLYKGDYNVTVKGREAWLWC